MPIFWENNWTFACSGYILRQRGRHVCTKGSVIAWLLPPTINSVYSSRVKKRISHHRWRLANFIWNNCRRLSDITLIFALLSILQNLYIHTWPQVHEYLSFSDWIFLLLAKTVLAVHLRLVWCCLKIILFNLSPVTTFTLLPLLLQLFIESVMCEIRSFRIIFTSNCGLQQLQKLLYWSIEVGACVRLAKFKIIKIMHLLW